MTTIQEQVYKKLRRMIITTEFIPGQKISELNLSEVLNVGRTPIRESLKQLALEDLVYTIPKSGTFVSKIDMEKVRSARFIRENVESEIMVEIMVELTGKKKEADIEQLNQILKKQETAFHNKNVSRYYDLDNDFHRLCYIIVEKKQIWDWITQINSHLDRFRWLHLNTETFNYNTIFEEHSDILNAIEHGNTLEVRLFTSQHIHFVLGAKNAVVSKYKNYFKEPENLY